jgi:alcohol oxidase
VRHLPPLPSIYPLCRLRKLLVGGAAGCVVAGRLAAADPTLRILILEAGPPTYDDPAHRQPARFLSHLFPGSRTVRVHNTRPTVALGDRSAGVPCGQCLGGGGSVNCTFLRVSREKTKKGKRTKGTAGGRIRYAVMF